MPFRRCGIRRRLVSPNRGGVPPSPRLRRAKPCAGQTTKPHTPALPEPDRPECDPYTLFLALYLPYGCGTFRRNEPVPGLATAPSRAPATGAFLHFAYGVLPGRDFHPFADKHGCPPLQFRPDFGDILEVQDDASPAFKRRDRPAPAVHPNPRSRLAAQPIHGIRVVKDISFPAVLLKIQPFRPLPHNKINALRASSSRRVPVCRPAPARLYTDNRGISPSP